MTNPDDLLRENDPSGWESHSHVPEDRTGKTRSYHEQNNNEEITSTQVTHNNTDTRQHDYNTTV